MRTKSQLSPARIPTILRANLQTTGFLLAPDGKILNAVYFSGPIGRLVAEDDIGMVTYLRSKA